MSSYFSSPAYDYWREVGTLNSPSSESSEVQSPGASPGTSPGASSIEGARQSPGYLRRLTRLHQDLQLEHLRRENDNLHQTILHLMRELQHEEGRGLYTVEFTQLCQTFQEIDRIIRMLTTDVVRRQ